MRRRLWLLAGALATVVVLLAGREEYLAWERYRAALNAKPIDRTPAGAIVLAGSQSSSSVAAVDVETGAFAGAIPVQEGPHELAASPDGRWAIATMPGDAGGWWRPPWRPRRRVAVIDVGLLRVHRVVDLAPHSSPHGVVFVDNRIAAITSEPTRSVVFVEVESGAVLGAVEVGAAGSHAEPHILAVSPDRRRIYSANISSRTVTEIDAGTRTVIRQIALERNPVIVAAAEGTLWIIEHDHQTEKYAVVVVDTSSGSVLARFTDVHLPRRIAVSADNSVAVITDPGRHELQVYDVTTRTLRKRIQIGDGSGPSSVSFGNDPARAFVALGAGRIAEIDVRAGRMIRSVETSGHHPDGLVYVRRAP
jgi:YVTN family beta-propeller protein